jgi:hypothetical protein
MRKAIGWLLFVFGLLWGLSALLHFHSGSPDGLGYSRLIGRQMIPLLVGILGLYLAGVINNE